MTVASDTSTAGIFVLNSMSKWFFLAASLLIGCTSSSNLQTPTNTASTAAPIIQIDAHPKSTVMPIASDESPEPEPAPVPQGSGPLVGQRGPRIDAEFVSGQGPRSIEEARGKVVLVDFWATFCGPCMKSFRQYQALADQFGGELVVIAVSVDDPEDTDIAVLEGFVQMTGAKFTVLWDIKREAANAYRVPKMPSSYILDRTGIVRHIHAGYVDETPNEMARQIKTLLAK